MTRFKFKEINSLEKRLIEADRILKRYPDRIPIILEKEDKSKIDKIDKSKYLVPVDLTIGQFIYVIRKRLRINQEKAIFLFINNTLPPSGKLILDIYNEYKDEDRFLYIKYSGENTFGIKHKKV